jgi:t-SNARE complex subunit (syntaxin)
VGRDQKIRIKSPQLYCYNESRLIVWIIIIIIIIVVVVASSSTSSAAFEFLVVIGS